MLNKHSPIPLYYQLAEQLKEQIHLANLVQVSVFQPSAN